jgi:glutamate/tyrosine decarboxylase-like PLP-dependent enzyme
MDCTALEKLLERDTDTPTILISSAGTVNSGDFDDMKVITALQKRFDFWWHVDGAFGAFAASVPGLSHLVDGWEAADSITVDGHKWLNVPYDNGFYFIKKAHSTLQMNCFQNANAPYLGERLENFSYSNFGPENSRRLRALPVWFALKTYGAEGFQKLFERNIAQAQKLGALIEASEDFELLAPVRLNIVAFALKNEALQSDFTKSLIATRRVFMTPTKIFGRTATRAALVNWQTRDEDIDISWAEMQRALREVTRL